MNLIEKLEVLAECAENDGDDEAATTLREAEGVLAKVKNSLMNTVERGGDVALEPLTLGECFGIIGNALASGKVHGTWNVSYSAPGGGGGGSTDSSEEALKSIHNKVNELLNK